MPRKRTDAQKEAERRWYLENKDKVLAKNLTTFQV
jgi:hypothetical protein